MYVSPVVPRLPTNAEWHDPDNNDAATVQHLPSGSTHPLGDRNATEVENRNTEYVTCNRRTVTIKYNRSNTFVLDSARTYVDTLRHTVNVWLLLL